MKWRGRRTSSNVEDRRGAGRRGVQLSGGVIVVVIVISLLTGQNPLALLEQLGA